MKQPDVIQGIPQVRSPELRSLLEQRPRSEQGLEDAALAA